MNDDAQLIDRALAGDSEAFGQLVRRHQDRLYNTLVHVAGCREEAADVTQEAFVKAYIKLRTFRRNSAFYTWLYRIAFNISISRRRRQRKHASLDETRQAFGDEPVDTGESPSERIERIERADSVQRALSALPEVYRTVMVLREMEGRDYETISKMLKIPVGTVRSRLFRARIQMRDQLRGVIQAKTSE